MDLTRILYHLGMPKTGTSLLQNTMSHALVALRAKGVLYPRAGRAGNAHHVLTKVLREQGHTERATFLADLAQEIAAASADSPEVRVALVSSEGMVNLCGTKTASDLAEFIAIPGSGLQGTAVIFLREMTSYLESQYFQTTRFRSVDRSFEAYLGPRPKWMQNFLAGLNIMKARMGDAFEIVLATKGYDVLRAFEARLALPDRFLDQPSRKVGSTARPSLKSQIALMYLDWLETEVGFKINRQALSRLLSDGDVFADDVMKFTIYEPAQRARVVATFSAILKEAGFHDYAALSHDLPPQTLPHHVIDRSALSAADVAAVAARRELIEVRPKADRATRRASRRV